MKKRDTTISLMKPVVTALCCVTIAVSGFSVNGPCTAVAHEKIIVTPPSHIQQPVQEQNNAPAQFNEPKQEQDQGQATDQIQEQDQQDEFPSFYRGAYLTSTTACSPKRFARLAEKAKESHLNVLVIDVQNAVGKEELLPTGHLELGRTLGLHLVARVVVFPGGLSSYPPDKKRIARVLEIAEKAAQRGFREIQFDYIRFSDEKQHVKALAGVSLNERYRFIEGFFIEARKRLSPYGVRIAADVFGRIPLKTDDRIGQKMEVFDTVVDLICPMAYPSHYGTVKMKHDPYGTVYWTSAEAERRAKKAGIVTWIQAFKMAQPGGMPFKTYIQNQIKAVHDAKVRGFFLWNARQSYAEPFLAVKEYYDAVQ